MTAAAAAIVAIMSTLEPTIRSPQESVEKGPASTRRNHSSMTPRERSSCVYGKQSPIFMESSPGGRIGVSCNFTKLVHPLRRILAHDAKRQLDAFRNATKTALRTTLH